MGRRLAARGLMLAIVSAGSAEAQTSNLPPASDGAAPTEIVVTAEKRSSTVQKTAISITAISGAELAQRGVVDILKVATQTPGVAVRSAGPGQTELDFRGLTSSGGSAPTVGFYLDEVPVSPPAGANNGKVAIDPTLYDLARVEILRGPQGTLYGSGSMGGTFKLVTSQPDPKRISASADFQVSGTNGGGANGAENVMLNLPLVTDKVALRVVETYLHNSGWVDRVVLAPFPLESDFGTPPGTAGSTRGDIRGAPVGKRIRNVNDEDLIGVRASLLVQATDRLSITTSGLYQRITQGGSNTFDTPPGTAPARLAHYQPFDVAEPFSDRFWLASAVIKYDFDAFSVTSASSYYDRRQAQVQDLSEDFQILIATPFYIASPLTETDSTHQFSQELRVASSGGGKFNWLAGVFYSDFHSTFQQASVVADYVPLFGTANFYTASEPQHVQQIAGFGNLSYRFSTKLKATVGARYFHYKSSIQTVENGIAVTGGDALLTNAASQSANGVTPMANIAYTPDRNLLLYVTAAKGFRPGGGNQPVPVSGQASCLAQLESFGLKQAPTTYGPDTVWSFEGGEKARLGGGRVTLNGSVYYEAWRNIQQQVPLQCGFFYTTNAERANVYGAELETAFAIGRDLTLNASAAYTHARYNKDAPETGTAVGDRIPNVPEYTFSIGLGYRRELGDGRAILANASERILDGVEDVTAQRNHLPGYQTLDLRAGYEFGRYTIAIFGTNVTDTRAQLSDTNSLGANLPEFNRVATNQPRTIGVDFRLKL